MKWGGEIQGIANLVIGEAGSYAPSQLLSDPQDRAEFLKFHRGAAGILIGGQTARLEKYQRITAPLFICSASSKSTLPIYLANNPLVQVLNLSPAKALQIAKGSVENIDPNGYLAIEGGPNFLMQILESEPGEIDQLKINWVPEPKSIPAEFADSYKKLAEKELERFKALIGS
jgi:hypothetical protein